MEQLTINWMEKEFLPFLNFYSTDIITEESERIHRSRMLNMAMILGNIFKNKVTLVIHSEEGVCKVSTTVWGITDDRVILKGSISIPIRSILDVSIL